jgi:hypothetical protein
MMRVGKCWLALFCLCGLACSREDALQPVEGKVVFKDKGIQGAVVTFHPKGADPIRALRPVGFTKEDGAFTLQTGQKEGAPPGEYTVTVIWPKEVGPPKGTKILGTDSGVDTVDFFQGAYADAAKSAFQREIKRGPNKLEPLLLK